MPDYKQLCAELLRAMDEIEECEAVDWSLVKTKPLKMANQSMAEARAALSEPAGASSPINSSVTLTRSTNVLNIPGFPDSSIYK